MLQQPPLGLFVGSLTWLLRTSRSAIKLNTSMQGWIGLSVVRPKPLCLMNTERKLSLTKVVWLSMVSACATGQHKLRKVSVKTADVLPKTLVYKIVDRSDWQLACERGAYSGSPDDERDGFVHLSTAAQLEGTAAKFFHAQPGLLLIEFRAGDLGHALKWEPSRGGALFPHLYGPLPAEAALREWPLPLDEGGLPMLPKDVV